MATSTCQMPGCTDGAQVYVLTARNYHVEAEQSLCAKHSDILKRIWNECESLMVPATERTGIECDIRAVVADLQEFQAWLWIREKNGPRQLSIPIGYNDSANALIRILKKESFPRPLTYQAMASIIKQLGGQVQYGIIDFAEQSTNPPTLHAKLRITKAEVEVSVDVRPSDMLALVAVLAIPFFVLPSILDTAPAWK
jgi:bifunctional DNase/RNase